MSAVPIRRPKDAKPPLRWNRRLGEPRWCVEWIAQHSWLLLPYIAVIVTAMLVLQMKGR